MVAVTAGPKAPKSLPYWTLWQSSGQTLGAVRPARDVTFRRQQPLWEAKGLRPVAVAPEDFANRALEFDADKDGKLSKEELMKMGEQFGRGFGGGRPGAPPRPRDGEPRRPQRPE